MLQQFVISSETRTASIMTNIKNILLYTTELNIRFPHVSLLLNVNSLMSMLSFTTLIKLGL